MRGNLQAQRICIWTGVVALAMQAVGIVAIAEFIPPLDPGDTAEETARIYSEDTDRIRAGLIIFMVFTGLLAVWAATLTVQLRRVEGGYSVLTWAWVMTSALLVLEIIYQTFFWITATFRPNRSPEITQTLNDMAWIPFIGLTSTIVIQAALLGFLMLSDKRAQPIFPRWGGYFNLWIALLFTPGCVNVFFKDGPMAWDGIIAFLIPFAAYAIWIPVNTYLALGAIKHQEAEVNDRGRGRG